jgi:DNA repair exonuclease SbcCD ATPase subunit
MSTLKIRNIKIKAFRSFKGNNETGLLPDNGLISIFGKNHDTGGSNGSGKSNLHLAISYPFGYCPFPATELQCDQTNSPMQVELELEDSQGNSIILNKGKEKTSIQIGGIEFTGAKTVEEKLRTFLPISSDLLDTLTFRKQRSFGRFLTMTDGEKKEFLSSLLNLSSLEDQIALATTKINKSEPSLIAKRAELNSLKEHLPAEPEFPKFEKTEHYINSIALLNAENLILKTEESTPLKSLNIVYQEIKDIESTRPVVWSNLDGAISQVNSQITSLTEKLQTQLAREESALYDLKCKRDQVSKYIKTLKQRCDSLQALYADKERLEQQIQSATANACPTCKQTWIVSIQALENMDEQLASVIETIGDQEVLAASIHSQESALEDLQRQVDQFDISGSASIRTLISTLKDNLVVLTSKKSAEERAHLKQFEIFKNKQIEAKRQQCEAVIKKLEEIRNRIVENEHNAQLLTEKQEATELRNQDKNTRYKADLVTFQGKKDFYENKFKELDRLQVEINQETDFATLLKGFLNKIFEEVLDEISEETNKKLSRLSNVSSVTIQFLTERTTQKNTVKEEIRTILFKNGREVSTRSGLSGGQFASVEWATDLAINQVVCKRMNFRPGWLILDEPFDNHDQITKLSCLELLKQEASDKIIFIIDHSTETKEYFDKCVSVEFKDEVSWINNDL